MKATRTMAMAVGAALLAMGAAMAAPSVEIVSVQQQYPWTNTVDIVYQVEGVTNMDYFVKFTPTTSAGAGIPDVNGQYDIQVALTNRGTYTAQWFPQTNQQYTACKMTPSVFRGAAKDYMIVDLLTGAVVYEPMATQEASNQRYNTAEYKTTKMVFRLVKGDTYQIGHKDEAKNQPHNVVVKDYYLTIFPVTQAQYNLIAGSGSYAATAAYMKPVANVTWNGLRGSALPTAVPSSGWLASLRAKVKDGGRHFELPTESMWEVACRAGTTTKWFWGDDSSQGPKYAYYNGGGWNGQSATRQVGLGLPNQWGFYDMLGNGWEICLDKSTRDYALTTSDGMTPVVVTTAYVIRRGGCPNNDINTCCCSYHHNGSWGVNTGDWATPFRVARVCE